MRNKSKILLLVSLSFLTLLSLSTSGYAATAQWFPSAGTEIQYKVSTQVIFSNQTVIQSDTFDVYKGGVIIYIMPTSLNFYGRMPAGYTSLENATTLTMRHNYFDNTTTQLRRAISLWGRVTNFSNVDVHALVAWNGTWDVIKPFYLSDNVVLPKSDYTTNEGGDFADYLQNYLGLGQSPYGSFHMIGNSGGTTYYLQNSTSIYALYATNEAGQVTSYSHGTEVYGVLQNSNLHSTTYFFTLMPSIPAYPVMVFVTVAGLATLYLIWSIKKHRKINT